MSYYDDASIMFLAGGGAEKDGKVYNIKPVPVYGSEEVINGDFSTDSNWNKGTGWSISGGLAKCDGTQTNNSNLFQDNTVLQAGKTYRITFTISNYKSGSVTLFFGNTSSITSSSNGAFDVEVVYANGAYLFFQATSNFVASLDNVSAKEVLTVFGSDLVTNGDFATDSDWTKETGWSISGGRLVATNVSGSNTCYQVGSGIVAGKRYRVEFEITEYTAGAVGLRAGTGGALQTFNSIGVHSSSMVASGNSQLIWFNVIGTTTLKIDNVSVKEVLADSDLSFSRGSNLAATRVGPGPNYYIEKGRENILLQSNSFGTSSWTKSNSGVQSGKSGYDGSLNAWLFTSNGGPLFQYISFSGVSTYSVYAKANTDSGFLLRVDQSAQVKVEFNISTGAFISGANFISYKSQDVGNGWFRFSVTFLAASAQTAQFRITNKSGTNTSGSAFIQDAQLELGLAATAVIESGLGKGEAGLLDNTPRFSYSNGVSCASLLLEPTRANKLSNSEYINSGGTWVEENGADCTPNYATSPEGVGNATRVILDNSGANSLTRIYADFTPSASDTGTFYAKSNTGSSFNIAFYFRDNGFGTTRGSKTITITTEWQRFDLTADCSAAAGNVMLLIYNTTASEKWDFLMYGAQVEAGVYPTSYIPTYGTSQSRAAEVCVTGTPSTTLFGQTEGTVFCEYTPVSDDTTNATRFIRLANSNNSNQIYMQHEASNRVTAVAFNGSNQFVGQTLSGYISVGNTYKFAIAYKNGDYAFYADGVQEDAGAGTGLGTLSLDRLSFAATINKSAKVKQGIVFNTRLTNNDLSDITNPYKSYSEFVTAFGFTWESQDCTNNSIAVLKN